MSETVLATKLFPPSPTKDIVQRPRLMKILDQGSHRKLTLVSAPAGFGKSTLVGDWIVGTERKVAWVSLEPSDSNIKSFLKYFVSGIQNVTKDIGESALALLQGAQPVQSETVLEPLFNEISQVPYEFSIVFDDYHSLDSNPVDEALNYIVEHMPPQMHLVVVTREDPSIPLPRFRARQELIEIRENDLRFQKKEIKGFLNNLMHLNLVQEDILALEDRTEGWITGLHLAAISLQGSAQPGEFIKNFTGSNRYVLDYLVEEIMNQLPENVLKFLLYTSILDRFSVPLCNALLFDKKHSAKEVLEYLEKSNLMLIPLDDRREWYRYHHLFSDVLSVYLADIYHDMIPELHLRASKWYEEMGADMEAIIHAIKGKHFNRAANLAELVYPKYHMYYPSIEWLEWLKGIPEEIINTRPVLCINVAWAHLNAGDLEPALHCMDKAEYWLNQNAEMKQQSTKNEKMIISSESQFENLPYFLVQARLYHAQATGDTESSLKYAQKALEILPVEQYEARAATEAMLGIIQWSSGDLESAFEIFRNGMFSNDTYLVSGTLVLAGMKMTMGNLSEAESHCLHAIELAQTRFEKPPTGTEDVYSSLAEVNRERGMLDQAAKNLKRCEALGSQVQLSDWQSRYLVSLAKLKCSMGQYEQALKIFNKAESVFVRTPLPIIQPISAHRARVQLKLNHLIDVEDWIKKNDIHPDKPLQFLYEYELITYARYLQTKFSIDQDRSKLLEAISLLKRLKTFAENQNRRGSLLEILILLSLIQDTAEQFSPAQKTLVQAIKLAEAEGYVQMFVDEGESMEQLLKVILDLESPPEYAKQLLNVFKEGRDAGSELVNLGLVDPLSPRELEIIQLIGQGLSNTEICAKLFVAMSTIKNHNQRIFEKLGVNRRTEAVIKAQKIGLI